MSIIDEIDKFKNDQKYLIDYSNLKDGFMRYQKSFSDKDLFFKFLKNKYMGLPLLLPVNLKYFKYGEKNFTLYKNDIKKLFNVRKKKYNPLNLYQIYGNKFASEANIKKKYINLVNKISRFNLKSFENINKIKNKKVIAFQTRNIPHLGHEKIIKHYLSKNYIVVVNPLLGPKKKGDIKSKFLIKFYLYLKKKYKNKNLYVEPIIANMFYAGPREAMHHANIRQMFGFGNFIIGRDHAGAENAYNKDTAIKYAKKYKKKFKIKLNLLQGSYYCTKCDKIILFEKCIYNHKRYLRDISGSKFRDCMNKKKIFDFADKKLQMFIFRQKKHIFY